MDYGFMDYEFMDYELWIMDYEVENLGHRNLIFLITALLKFKPKIFLRS